MATKSISGTQTEKNIVSAYLAESQSFARYGFYAKVADKEKYFPVGVIFRETANNELHHAKVFLKMLESTQVQVTTGVDAGYLGDTVSNLELSMKEESVSGHDFYMAAAKTATDEGFPEIAAHFRAIASVEKGHYERFALMLDHIKKGTMWKREQPVTWRCLVCGFQSVGTEPPATCPGCDHPYQHYVALEDGFAPSPLEA